MQEILKKLKEEFFAVLPPTIFCFAMLHIVGFIRVLMATDRISSLCLPLPFWSDP